MTEESGGKGSEEGVRVALKRPTVPFLGRKGSETRKEIEIQGLRVLFWPKSSISGNKRVEQY